MPFLGDMLVPWRVFFFEFMLNVFFRLWRNCEELGIRAIEEHLSNLQFVDLFVDVLMYLPPQRFPIYLGISGTLILWHEKGELPKRFKFPFSPPSVVGVFFGKPPRNTNADFVVRLFNGPLDSVPWRLGHWTVGSRSLETLKWNVNGLFRWNLVDLLFCFQSVNRWKMHINRIHIL